jgi:hypothetical protein
MKTRRRSKSPEEINAALAAKKGPVSKFVAKNYRHFNAAALLDAAKGYEAHLAAGGKMLMTIAGAMSTAELGISLAEMIRREKVAPDRLHRREPRGGHFQSRRARPLRARAALPAAYAKGRAATAQTGT